MSDSNHLMVAGAALILGTAVAVMTTHSAPSEVTKQETPLPHKLKHKQKSVTFEADN